MRHDELITIPGTAVQITRLGLGTVPIGGLYNEVSPDMAQQTLAAAYRLGIRYFDTAPLYGFGLAEQRLGHFLHSSGHRDVTVSTKVGRLLRVPGRTPDGSSWPAGTDPDDSQVLDGAPIFKGIGALRPVWDFSFDGTLRSVEESLRRLSLEQVKLLYIHDPEDHMDQAISGAWRALTRLRDEGVIGAIGVGLDHCWIGERFVAEAPVDCLLVAGRLTLLDRSAQNSLLPMCSAAGVSIIAGSVFNSGILASDTINEDAHYWYSRANPDIVAHAQKLEKICRKHGIPLRAAALQFPYRFDPVTAVVVGARSPDEIADDVAMLNVDIPADLWAELDELPAPEANGVHE